MVAWTVLSLLFLISLLIIGLRHWEGWVFATITSAGWIVYFLVGGVRVVELIVSVLGLGLSVLFLVRWNRAQRAVEEAAVDNEAPVATGLVEDPSVR